MSRRILFFRDYEAYSGGHGKVRDYFEHCFAHPDWVPSIHFSERSLFDDTNPWRGCPDRLVARWEPGEYDALFVAGLDWCRLDDSELPADMPIVNLIQGIRHADSGLPLRRFLGREALRVCVSQPVADAIHATAEVNGPVRVIPAALSLPPLPEPGNRSAYVFIGALKRPALGRALATRLRLAGHEVRLLETPLPRAQYLSQLAQARLAVLLPCECEGFYLPGLEAMALGTPVVMLDAVGNRQYARPGENCEFAEAMEESLALAVARLDEPARAASYAAQGLCSAEGFSLESERAAFWRLLDELFPPAF
ncbi:MAG: glycosyltransferase [Gammaproteobacteria bacterium]|nr:glycosyltransferase [Gammaproteobacteria bacterium]